MSEEDKSKITKSTPIKDVTDADKVAPSDTSKSIITNRPMVKDPMVKEEAKDAEVEQDTKKDDKINIGTAKTLEVTPGLADDKKSEDDKKPEPPEPAPDVADDDKKSASEKDDNNPEDPTAELKEADTKKAEHDAEVEKLIDSKKYELPITTMEKRRSTRFVILGLLLAIFLILAWINIALDAQLIQIEGLNPVTHIFSN